MTTTMNIQTSFDHPPIPSRKYDWSAVDANTYSGDETEAVGRGATEEAAIASLMGQMGATCEEVAYELAGRGFTDAQIAKVMNTEVV